MRDMILTCNAGSNSLKASLYTANAVELAYRMEADRIHDESQLTVTDAQGGVTHEDKIDTGYDQALQAMLAWMDSQDIGSLAAVGHRIVHGGEAFDGPVQIDGQAYEKMEALIPLAPLHQPHNLKLVDIMQEAKPDVPQVACFDTAFHRTQPEISQLYALPHELMEEEHIRRYGFHGLSYEAITERLHAEFDHIAEERVIIVHLGSGASICALKDGKSHATTMGFTALDGLMMSTRCGDLDPGVVLYLMKEKGMSAEEVEEMLYKESGLLGVSGISADMRDLDLKEDPRAQQAVELFCHMAARQLGGLLPLIGGLDRLVFTGAMGVNDLMIRARIADNFKWLGLEVDEMANANDATIISAPQSTVQVMVLPTDEEGIIARQTSDILNKKETHDGREQETIRKRA